MMGVRVMGVIGGSEVLRGGMRYGSFEIVVFRSEFFCIFCYFRSRGFFLHWFLGARMN